MKNLRKKAILSFATSLIFCSSLFAQSTITPDSLLTFANEMVGQKVAIKGYIEHVCSCSNPGKNVRLHTPGVEGDIKVLLPKSFPVLSVADEGRYVEVTGILEAELLDLNAVHEWKKRVLSKYKGLEHTEHFKEHYEEIQIVLNNFSEGKITHHPRYHVRAEDAVIK